MARRKRVYDKPVHKDSRYDSQLVAHLIARVMQSGKKSLAERIVYAAIEQLNEKTDSVDPLELFNRAIENSKPRVEVKARRVGGAPTSNHSNVRGARARHGLAGPGPRDHPHRHLGRLDRRLDRRVDRRDAVPPTR